MPTTANGTSYTVHTATVAGGGATYWGVPDASTGPVPAVLYCHGAAGAANQFATLAAWTGLRDWLIDNGWIWIEGAGGGSQPWGNQASQDAYDASFDHVDALLDIDYVVVLGRSMGGAVGARLYVDRRVGDARWVGFISNSGVQDLVWAYDWDGGRWTAAFNSAWGVSSKPQFEAAVAGLNPIDGPATEWAGAKVIQLWGDADDTVPPADNAIAMRAMYAGQPTVDGFDVRAGGDHSSTNGSYLEVDAMTAFLLDAIGEAPTPTPPKEMYRSVRRTLLIDGLRHRVRPRVA